MALRQETGTALAPPLLHEPFRENPAQALPTDDFDDDEFEDAAEELPSYSLGLMDLHSSFADCEVAVRRFFNNDVEGAMSVMSPWNRTSLYHSLGAATFEFIPAMLTFDHAQITRALSAIKVCVNLCNKLRRNYTFVESIGTIIRKTNYSTYTDIEAHAELCYAEALLLQAAMTIMEGEDLTGLIKGTIKIKNCYNSYKECQKIFEKKTIWDSEESMLHFQSGVRLGTATFYLMISLLPHKIISVLEFVGFSGNKSLGLAELEIGSRAPGLRSVLCDLTLLGYHLVVCHFIGANSDLRVCQEILQRKLKLYPDGVWFLLFKGRYQLMQGQMKESIVSYNRAVICQDMWKQFTQICFWEIMWVNSLQMEWREAVVYATKLLDESSWSRTIYSYTKGALLLQLGEKITSQERQECNDLMRNASYYKQRIAGKSLPMEKFVIRRCARYHAQGGRLILPAVELLCLWNMFGILAKDDKSAQRLLKLIESARESVDNGPAAWMAGYEADNRALVRYLQGSLLAAMGLPRLALDTLHTIPPLKADIKEDTFLLPYTMVEMAMCYYQLGELEPALQMLHDARKRYSGYSLESRLHFRLHSKTSIVKNGGALNKNNSTSNNSK